MKREELEAGEEASGGQRDGVPLESHCRGEDCASLFDAGAALLLFRPTREIIQAVLGEAEIRESDEGEALEDWSDLFFSPRSGRYLPPLEAARREGRLGGPLAAAVRECYRAAGFEPERLDMDPFWRAALAPDHLGVELAFVSALLRCGQAESARRFHAEHLEPWAGDYGRELARLARSPLYRAAGELLQRLGAATL